MKSEFEKAYSPNPHKSPFTEVRFNEEKQIYEPLNQPLDRVARSLNAAWYGYRIRQTEVDELTLQVAEMKSRLNDAYTDGQSAMYTARQTEVDELQKMVDAVKGLAQTLWEKSEEKHQQGKVWESKTLGECADEILDVLEQALKGGGE